MTEDEKQALMDQALLNYLRDSLEQIASAANVSPLAAYGPKPNGVLLQDILLALRAEAARASVRRALGDTGLEVVDVDAIAAAVHDNYLATCKRLNWEVKPENQGSYSELSEASKELDRSTVRTVLDMLYNEGQDSK